MPQSAWFQPILCQFVGLYRISNALFSPLGKLADWAIYFTFRNFFFFYSEQSYLSRPIYWTDFHDLFTK